MKTLEDYMNSITKYYASKIYELYDINAINIENKMIKQGSSKNKEWIISVDDFIRIRCKALDLILSTMYSICIPHDEEIIHDLFVGFLCLTQYDIEYEKRISEEDKTQRLGKNYIESYAKYLIDYDVDYAVGLRGKTISKPKEAKNTKAIIYNSKFISNELRFLVTDYKNIISNIKDLISSNCEVS